MLSSTVLVSTATTPTGIPPSLPAPKQIKIHTFTVTQLGRFSNLHQNTQKRQIMHANGGGRSTVAFSNSLDMRLDRFRAQCVDLKAKPLSEH